MIGNTGVRNSHTFIETDRLFLRNFKETDDIALLSIFGDAEVMKYGDGVKSLTWTRNWLFRCCDMYQNESVCGPLAVIHKKQGETLGYCGLTPVSDVCGHEEIQLGYRLAKKHWKKGYATEAARAILDYGFNTLGLTRVVAIVDPANRFSLRVVEKIGMVYEKDVLFYGYTHPDHVYVIQKNDM